MELLHSLLDLVAHLDQHLLDGFAAYGVWAYAALFLIICCESTLTPFLPGDSLLFAAGALATSALISVHGLWVLLTAATVLGMVLSYAVGRRVGPAAFREERRFLNLERLERTRRFYRAHGGETMLLARFIPVIRTFAPLVAGIVAMDYVRFLFYNLIGGGLWVALFLYGGYFFGALPVVRDHFAFVVFGVFLVSMVPLLVEWVRTRGRIEEAAHG